MGKLLGKLNDPRIFPTGQREYETFEWKSDWIEIAILGSIWAALVFIILFK